MNRQLIRLFLGAVLAVPVAGGLFFIMQYLIASADPQIDDANTTKLADIHMPEREIETNITEKKPDKVEDPEEPPPDLDTPDIDMDMDVDSADRTTQTTNWTGALPPGDPNATKTFAEGDCDADGDVDTADQNGTITNWTGAMNAGVPVVTYVNSTAEVKALSDTCCTSANAVEIVSALDAERFFVFGFIDTRKVAL